MFVAAVENALKFTRPIHTIVRYWGSDEIQPSTSSLFFVNDEGWALTCKHVADSVVASGQVTQKFSAFKTERKQLTTGKMNRKATRKLEEKYGYKKGVAIEALNAFVNCVHPLGAIKMFLHDKFDVALMKFEGFENLSCSYFPTFAKDETELKQGNYVCRLGYPFPEFTNFELNTATDSIQWTTSGRRDTPSFPIDGMVTRHLGKSVAEIFGFELSTPGLRGQSGGPAFIADGRIVGLQYGTNTLDLNFDVDRNVTRNGETRHVRDYAFLHVGHCVHLNILKDFMRKQSVSFAEA
jgi:hypothetical protein